MQRAQPARHPRWAFVRSLLLGIGFALAAALLLWLKTVETDGLGLSLPSELQDFTTLALSIVVEALPFVILGALVSVIVRLFAPTERILRLLPKRPLLRRLSISLFGTFMPVCECGNVPVARGLVIRGLSVAESTTFLLAAPIINPVTLLATWQAFPLDPSIVWIRMAGGLLIANLVGGLIALYKDQMELVSKGFYNTLCQVGTADELNYHEHHHGHHDHDQHHEHHDDHDHHEHHDHDHDHHHASNRWWDRWQEGIVIFRDEVSLMLKVLCLGALIAGATQVFVPRDVLTSLGSDPFLSILAMIALAFIISICANVDAFFALAYSNTFTTGSIVAFLVFGPMIDIKMLTMMRTTYKVRLLAVITLVVTLMSILIGLVVNYAL